jgi:uncharacterized membrane protein
MKHFTDFLAIAVFALFITGTVMALEQVIGHPARYVEQPERASVS